jgi:hypothetical protein
MMKTATLSLLLLSDILLGAASFAGSEIKPEVKAVADTTHVRTWFPSDPAGMVTLGGLFSEGATGVYFDSITGLYAPPKRDAFLFLNSRYHWEDQGQFISSSGLGFRAMCPQHEIIVGLNGFWDSLHSAHDNDFSQLGLGAEVLTHWVDARFNYYLPEDDRYEIGRRTTAETQRSVGPEFTSGAFIAHDLRETTQKRAFRSYEAALEGYNAEIGFLVPGLDRYTEVRLFAGYYHYDNPFGSDFEGFKARLEARVLPGVMAGVEYWDDAVLMGGHWTADVRVSVPFSIYNLVTGRNPFAGIANNFVPRRREFRERLGDMIERSHRIQTTTSGDVPAGVSTSTQTTTQNLRPASSSPAFGGVGGGGFPVE